MFIPSIDNPMTEVKTDAKVVGSVTHFVLKGSTMEIEGYASVDGVYSYTEDRTRKTLLFVPQVNLKKYREEHLEEDDEELTDEEIMELHILNIPLENCKLDAIRNNQNLKIDDEESLGGFKAQIDLATMVDEKPLAKGKYQIYIKLEQLPNNADDIKYLKTIPIANIKDFLHNGIMTTHLHYYSPKRVLKYNLIGTFDTFHKTLHFDNILLQSYNPDEFSEEGVREESRYIKAIKRRLFRLFYILFTFLPIRKGKITFASDSRSELNGNLYFVYEELYKRDIDVKIKFLFNDRIDQKKTTLHMIRTAYHFATSKIILLDDFYPLIYPLKIRKNADLIQVWHAAGAFKTFGFSRVGRPGGPSIKSRNHRNYTKAAVSSAGVREHYAEGFGITEDKVYATGVPRSDIFFDESYKEYVSSKLYERYPFLKEKKVILFAPTFRGNGQASAFYPFEELNFKELYDGLHEEYVFLFKIHPFVKNSYSIPYEYSDFFYDLSDYREINDLLLVTDVLITDYSSVCFEFALLKKPMLFFAFDVEKYIQERDFYYNYFDFIPGPLIRSTEEIVDTIQKKRFQLDKIDSFVKYFFDDTLGRASENVVNDMIIPSLETNYKDQEEKKVVLPPPKSRIELFERSLEEEDEAE